MDEHVVVCEKPLLLLITFSALFFLRQFVRMSGCGCGSSCNCGSGCTCGKMYPDLSYTEKTTTSTLVMGVAPAKAHFDGAEMSVEAENGGCKCGSNCTCDPCNCK